MKDYANSLFEELNEELSVYADLGTIPVRKLAGVLTSIGTAIEKLNAYLNEHPFQTQKEEIDFFKHLKPRFNAERFYAMEIFHIETNRPIIDPIQLKAFYEKELQYIDRFFNQYQFLYQYYRFEFKELDSFLFVTGAEPPDIILREISGPASDCSTCCDLLFGKFIAYERLKVFLIGELKSLENPIGSKQNGEKEGFIDLKWTGETINLVEVAYGIWLTGQVNNGNASITEIIGLLETCFQVKIGTAFRRWQSISSRKRIQPTKYLDQMREAVLKRLEEENGR